MNAALGKERGGSRVARCRDAPDNVVLCSVAELHGARDHASIYEPLVEHRAIRPVFRARPTVPGPAAPSHPAARERSSLRWEIMAKGGAFPLTDLGLSLISAMEFAPPARQYVEYRVGIEPRDESLLTHQLVASRSIQSLAKSLI